jgi:hypothetical protein
MIGFPHHGTDHHVIESLRAGVSVIAAAHSNAGAGTGHVGVGSFLGLPRGFTRLCHGAVCLPLLAGTFN